MPITSVATAVILILSVSTVVRLVLSYSIMVMPILSNSSVVRPFLKQSIEAWVNGGSNCESLNRSKLLQAPGRLWL
jgi:hypothetical protein